jgi:hypothetical protein
MMPLHSDWGLAEIGSVGVLISDRMSKDYIRTFQEPSRRGVCADVAGQAWQPLKSQSIERT